MMLSLKELSELFDKVEGVFCAFTKIISEICKITSQTKVQFYRCRKCQVFDDTLDSCMYKELMRVENQS